MVTSDPRILCVCLFVCLLFVMSKQTFVSLSLRAALEIASRTY